MEPKKINFGTYLKSWCAFSICTLLTTFMVLVVIGFTLGALNRSMSPDQTYQLGQTVGIWATIPVTLVSSLVSYCFCTWFFLLRHK
jgi:hypothetical protein